MLLLGSQLTFGESLVFLVALYREIGFGIWGLGFQREQGTKNGD